MCWVVIGETFPVRTRAKQASLATAGNWLGNFLISIVSPPADDGIGFAYGFVFVACNLAGALLVWFFLYESRNLSLENVDRMYSVDGLKAWKSGKWVPPGYITREQRDEDDFRRASTVVGSHAGDPPMEKEKRSVDNEGGMFQNGNGTVAHDEAVGPKGEGLGAPNETGVNGGRNV